MLSRIFGLIFAMTLLAGCATTYHPDDGVFGGYGEEPAPTGLTKIYFSGNGVITIAQAKAYVLRRAAEIGKVKNKPFFAVFPTITDAINNKKAVEANYALLFGFKPTGYAYIEYHDKHQKGDISVEDVLRQYNK